MADTLFFLQKAIMLNETIDETTPYGIRLQNALYECYDNEALYRTVKFDKNSVFKDLAADIEM